jgi:hypothetical protein
MARYVFRDGQYVNRETGEPMLTAEERARPLAVPYIIADIPSYQSPIDGRVIGSRSERRDDLKRNNCVEYEPSLSPTKGKFKNKHFTAKRGMQVSEEFR